MIVARDRGPVFVTRGPTVFLSDEWAEFSHLSLDDWRAIANLVRLQVEAMAEARAAELRGRHARSAAIGLLAERCPPPVLDLFARALAGGAA